MATIKIRRGLKSALDGLINPNALELGEIVYTTDTEEIFVGDGADNHILTGKAFVQTTDPNSISGTAETGRLWLDTTDDATYIYDGTSWVDVSSGIATLDDISDGTTYGKVAVTELQGGSSGSGTVNRLNDGTNTVTASEARTHLDDTSIHSELNDASTSSTELWSSDKISSEISAVVSGIDPQDSVISQLNLTTSEPALPSVGDRYINTATGTSSENPPAQSVTANNIYEWNGTNWTETVANEGMYTWDETLNSAYVYNGSAWVLFSTTVSHNDLAGKQGGTTDQYYHMTEAEDTALAALVLASNDVGATYHDHDSIYFTETELAGVGSATTSGAYLIGVFDEFDNSTSTTVQGVLNDLDAQITTNLYTDADAEDAAGLLMTDSTDIDFTYTANTSITASILQVDGGSF